MGGFKQKLFAGREQLSADYAVLGSSLKVARKYGVSKGTVLNHMVRLGIARKEPVPVEAIRQLAVQGQTVRQIADHFHKTRTHIQTLAKANGIRISDPFHKRFTICKGYKLLYVPSHPCANSKGYVPEHRLVAERTIARVLRQDEIAHHVNGDKLDNRPENLVIVSKAEHNNIHRPGQAANRKGGKEKKPRHRANPSRSCAGRHAESPAKATERSR